MYTILFRLKPHNSKYYLITHRTNTHIDHSASSGRKHLGGTCVDRRINDCVRLGEGDRQEKQEGQEEHLHDEQPMSLNERVAFMHDGGRSLAVDNVAEWLRR